MLKQWSHIFTEGLIITNLIIHVLIELVVASDIPSFSSFICLKVFCNIFSLS